MKEINTTNNNNVRNEATAETMVQEAAVNCIDDWASRVAGAKTPINLKVNVSVSGSIGDVNANFTISGSLNNSAYRNHTKQHAKRNRRHNKNHDSGNCKCEKQNDICKYDIVKGTLMSLLDSKKLKSIFYFIAKDGVRTYIDNKIFNCNMGKALLLEGLITVDEAASIDAVLNHAPNSFNIRMGAPWEDYKAAYDTYECGRYETTKDFINRVTKK